MVPGVLDTDSELRKEESRESITLLDIATALLLRKRFILAMTVAAAIVGAIAALLIHDRYTAITKLLPPQQSQSSAAALLSSLSTGPMGALAASAGKDFGLKNPNELFVGILKTRPIADALIRRFDLQKVYRARDMTSARKELAADSQIVSEKDGLISITVQDRDKKRAADLANAYIDEVRALTSGLALTEASERRLFYEEQLKRAKDDLADAEVAFKEQQQKNGIIQVDAQAKALIQSIASLRAQLVAKQVELQALRSYATDQNAEVAIVQQEIAGIQAELTRLEKRGAGTDIYDVSLKNVPESGLAFIRAYREVRYRETIFELLAKQYEAARLDEARNAPLIQVVEPAIEPDRATFPNRMLIIFLCSVLGCFSGSLLTIISLRQSQVKEDPRYIERLSALRAALRSK